MASVLRGSQHRMRFRPERTMKPSKAFSLAILCSLMVVLSSRDVGQIRDVQLATAEDRDYVTTEMMEKYLKQKDDLAGPVLNLAIAAGDTISTMSSIDYTRSGGQVALDVANAVVPAIGAALALVPGVGPLVSGLFMGVWGLVSPLFATKKDNPMEKMINELAEKMKVMMDDKLSSVINRAVHGEIARNNYICTKYNFMFKRLSKKLKSNTTLAPHDALRLSGYLNDCDNFLKDTAEAFVYDEYADVLWVPSAITTSVRVSFITEVIKYGHLMGIEPKVIAMYFKELQNDITRQFKLHRTGLNKLRQELVDKKVIYSWPEDYLEGLSSVEEAACQIQSQLLYFNRELYPYGMPKVLNSTDIFAEIKMQDHYDRKKNGSVFHLQVFFDVYRSTFPGVLPDSNINWYYTLKIMNCIMGPMYPRFPSAFWFTFTPMHSNQYSYEFRVMYFHTREYGYNPTYPVPVLLAEKRSNSKEYQEFEKTHRRLKMGNPDHDDINLQIKFVSPRDSLARRSKKILDMPIVAHWQHCPYQHDRGYEANICEKGIKFYDGMFRMYSAGTYNIDQWNKISHLVRIGNPSLTLQGKGQSLEYGFLVGMEIIVRPRIE